MSQPDYVTLIIQSRVGRARARRNIWLRRIAASVVLTLAILSPSPSPQVRAAVNHSHQAPR